MQRRRRLQLVGPRPRITAVEYPSGSQELLVGADTEDHTLTLKGRFPNGTNFRLDAGEYEATLSGHQRISWEEVRVYLKMPSFNSVGERTVKLYVDRTENDRVGDVRDIVVRRIPFDVEVKASNLTFGKKSTVSFYRKQGPGFPLIKDTFAVEYYIGGDTLESTIVPDIPLSDEFEVPITLHGRPENGEEGKRRSVRFRLKWESLSWSGVFRDVMIPYSSISTLPETTVLALEEEARVRFEDRYAGYTIQENPSSKVEVKEGDLSDGIATLKAIEENSGGNPVYLPVYHADRKVAPTIPVTIRRSCASKRFLGFGTAAHSTTHSIDESPRIDRSDELYVGVRDRSDAPDHSPAACLNKKIAWTEVSFWYKGEQIGTSKMIGWSPDGKLKESASVVLKNLDVKGGDVIVVKTTQPNGEKDSFEFRVKQRRKDRISFVSGFGVIRHPMFKSSNVELGILDGLQVGLGYAVLEDGADWFKLAGLFTAAAVDDEGRNRLRVGTGGGILLYDTIFLGAGYSFEGEGGLRDNAHVLLSTNLALGNLSAVWDRLTGD